MIFYGKHNIDSEDIKAVIKALKSNNITQGSKISDFEKSLCEKFGSKYSCVVSSGTAALHLTGLALGWNSNDIILTTPITFLATANCIVYNGARPDFCDIDKRNYTIDPNQIEEKVKYYQFRRKKVKAIIAVDYAGNPCDWKSLKFIADKYNLQLVNDNCHALGSSYLKNKKYASKYADVVTHSYHPVKHITTGEGGAILSNNKDIIDKVKLLRSHGIVKSKNKISNYQGPWYYELNELGFNYRLTDFQCALGINQLKKLDNYIKKRQKIAKIYNNSFKDNMQFTIPYVSKKSLHSYHLYPLLINFENYKIKKNNFFNILKKNNISLQVHYIPIHLQPYYKNNYGFNLGDFPIAEKFYSREISLPIYPDLTKTQVQNIIKQINTHLN